jgi:hypothetical protein
VLLLQFISTVPALTNGALRKLQILKIFLITWQAQHCQKIRLNAFQGSWKKPIFLADAAAAFGVLDGVF